LTVEFYTLRLASYAYISNDQGDQIERIFAYLPWPIVYSFGLLFLHGEELLIKFEKIGLATLWMSLIQTQMVTLVLIFYFTRQI
jgi:hypothetical protein